MSARRVNVCHAACLCAEIWCQSFSVDQRPHQFPIGMDDRHTAQHRWGICLVQVESRKCQYKVKVRKRTFTDDLRSHTAERFSRRCTRGSIPREGAWSPILATPVAAHHLLEESQTPGASELRSRLRKDYLRGGEQAITY